MNCRLRFYNAVRAEKFGKKLDAVDTLILRRSRPHVHCEFEFSERYGNISFSATLQDGSHGCRFKPIDYNEHPERWDTLWLPMTDEQEDRAYARARELDGKEYDLIGLLSFATALNLIKPDPDKYFCSEVDGELIVAAYGLTDFRCDEYCPTPLFFEMFYRLTK
jgi:hypothetical protein